MPEKEMKQKHSRRPTSDIIMEAGKRLEEVEKCAVADSNKHVSMLLARSRSLDLLSSSSVSANAFERRPEKNKSSVTKDDKRIVSNSLMYSSPSPYEERDCEQADIYVANNMTSSSASPTTSNSAESSSGNNDRASFTNVKDDNLSIVPHQNAQIRREQATLLKEKSELNNNHNNYNSSSRSSSVSTTSNSSSNHSAGIANKVKRRSSSSTTGGAAAYHQEVVLNEPVRITGYLEKRSKVLGWKKFWFVLDGRLLTYYKSKADYESLSACCGCINLGIASAVRPIQIRGCKGYPLQIVTRSQVYYLRSQDKPTLEQWLIAIQEAASSAPASSALPSWNSYSGSQYFRNSFTSQSQWSLNNSTEDITDISERLGNLPDAFYQKRDKGSFLSSSSSHTAPVIQKFHSIACLQTPVINNFHNQRSRIIVSSTENLRDLRDHSSGSSSMMQQSASLLVLDSSPQAAELRKELTRKLSIGSSRTNSINETENETTPTPKFLLQSAKKKLESGDDESHHYDEIGEFEVKHYENFDAEEGHSIANNKRSNVRGDSVEKESNIYEHIETVDPTCPVIWEPLSDGNNCNNPNNKRLPHRHSTGSNRNSLVSISELPEDISSTSPSPIKATNLASIPEATWRSGVEPYKCDTKPYSEDDLSSCRSESFRSLPCTEKSSNKKRTKGKVGSFFSKVFGKKGKGKTDPHENFQQSLNISGPVDLRSMQLPQKPAFAEPLERRPFTKPPAQIKQRSNSTDSNDQQDGQKTSPLIPGSRMTINNTVVMDELKQKVGHITLKRTNSRSNTSLESPSNEEQSNHSKPSATVEPRVPYVPRPTNAVHNHPTPVLIFQTQERTMESSTDDDDLMLKNEVEKETQVASICISPENELSSLEPDNKASQGGEIPVSESPSSLSIKPERTHELPQSKTPPTMRVPVRNKNPEDFQNKLAKFNRLSQSLSASFMAALGPSQMNYGQMGRSHSYKAYRNKGNKDDIIPPLPPKKKNCPGGSTGTILLYDVPLNNKPVSDKSDSSAGENQGEKSIAAFIRDLTKKNSTPDIVLSGNGSKPFFRDVVDDPKELHRALNSSDERFDVHKSNPTLPPPRPPKPKPPAKPKSLDFDLNRMKRSSGSSTSSSDTVANHSSSSSNASPSTPVKGLLELPNSNTSPTTSSKSLSFDILDRLSDAGLSDTKVSNSPPESPRTCPIHPDANLHDESALSSVAQTPDISLSDTIAPDSLATTPCTDVPDTPSTLEETYLGGESDTEPISINKLEIVIRDNDGSPSQKSPDNDNESRMDSLERNAKQNTFSITSNPHESPPSVYQNLKFATVSTLIQEFETVEENEDEISELYDDFPAEFYTPTPSSFSGYSPSEASTTSSDSSSLSSSSSVRKHVRIDSIRNSGMEQLEAFLSFGSSNSSSDEYSFESCTEGLSEEGANKPYPPSSAPLNNNNNHLNKGPTSGTSHFHSGPGPAVPGVGGVNRTGAISRLGHSSAIGHLQKILTSDVK